jgi:ferritin-like metal-binding protein YciE
MDKSENLREFFLQQLRIIYDGEKKIALALPQMKDLSSSEDVRGFLQKETDEKDRIIHRLDEIFHRLEMSPRGASNEAIGCLLEEKRKSIEKSNERMKEAVIIIYSRILSVFQIAAYRAAISCAMEMGDTKITSLVKVCLREEKSIEKAINTLEEKIMEREQNPSLTFS